MEELSPRLFSEKGVAPRDASTILQRTTRQRTSAVRQRVHHEVHEGEVHFASSTGTHIIWVFLGCMDACDLCNMDVFCRGYQNRRDGAERGTQENVLCRRHLHLEKNPAARA